MVNMPSLRNRLFVVQQTFLPHAPESYREATLLQLLIIRNQLSQSYYSSTITNI